MLERLVALLITVAAFLVLINGSIFSTWGANHVDLSINLVAADALRDGVDPYGRSTLLERARSLGSPTNLIYSQLFTSYIQPPTSALHLLPLSALPWRDATRVYLVVNHVLLLGSVALTLSTIRPALSLRWTVAGVAVILALFSQIYGSFTLGQVDATLCFLLALGFWGYVRRKPAVTGTALALGAAIKLIPALLLLYFLWKREYRTVLWGAGAGAALFLLSLAYVGPGVYETYLTDTLPAISKGSTQYSNISLGAVIARFNAGEIVRGLPYLYSLDEAPGGGWARLAAIAIGAGALVAVALVTGRGRRAGAGGGVEADDPAVLRRRFWEYYLVVAVALVISSVTWEFYVIWLLPVFIAVFLAPERLLPGGLARPGLLALFAALLLALNLPGDLYLFGPNDFFYHPEWVPGVWVEDRVGLYHTHLDAVLLLRLPALLLCCGVLAGLVLYERLQERPRVTAAEAAPRPGTAPAQGAERLAD